MSFAAEGWAWEQVCPSSAAKLVLVCLGWFANKEGKDAYPSIRTICQRTQLVERTVRKAISELIETKFIEREADFDPYGRCRSNRYRLVLSDSTPANMQEGDAAIAPANMQGSTPAESQEGHLQICTPHPCNSAPVTPANMQENPSLELRKKEGKPVRTRARRAVDESNPPECRVLFDAWNEMARRANLPTAIKLTPDRRGHLNARLKTFSVEEIGDAIAKVGTLRWCREGTTTHPNWRADFDWLVTEKAIRKLLEGRYDDHEERNYNPAKLTGFQAELYRIERERAELARRSPADAMELLT